MPQILYEALYRSPLAENARPGTRMRSRPPVSRASARSSQSSGCLGFYIIKKSFLPPPCSADITTLSIRSLIVCLSVLSNNVHCAEIILWKICRSKINYKLISIVAEHIASGANTNRNGGAKLPTTPPHHKGTI